MEKIDVFDVQIPDGRQIRLHRDGDRYWTTIDGVRQLYRRIECKMCFEVIEKIRGL